MKRQKPHRAVSRCSQMKKYTQNAKLVASLLGTLAACAKTEAVLRSVY